MFYTVYPDYGIKFPLKRQVTIYLTIWSELFKTITNIHECETKFKIKAELF